MIGIDSNVLIRYLTQDDPVQSPKATAFIERQLTAVEPGFISTVCIVEVVWVLDRAYGFSNRQIAAAVENLLQADNLTVEDEQQVFAAVVSLKRHATSFSDALLQSLGAAAG